MFEKVKAFGMGAAEFAAGLYVMDRGVEIREMVNQNGIPNWHAYEQLVSQIGKFQVDGLISWGNDLGGALMLISGGELMKLVASNEKEEALLEDLWNFAAVGFMGVLATVGELYDIGFYALTQKCSILSCGDVVDLAIFAGMATYPFVRRKMRERNNLSKQ